MQGKDFILKSTKKDDDGNIKIVGIASTEITDREGQLLMLDNIDMTYVNSGMSWIKYEHAKTPESFVGSVDKAEVKVNKDGIRELWIEGTVSSASDAGKKVIGLMKACKSLGKKMMISIEAGVTKWSDDSKKVAKSMILKHCSLTLDPVNLGTVALMKSTDKDGNEVETELLIDFDDKEENKRVMVTKEGEILIEDKPEFLGNSQVIEQLRKSFSFSSNEDVVKSLQYIQNLNKQIFNMENLTPENLAKITEKISSELKTEDVAKSTEEQPEDVEKSGEKLKESYAPLSEEDKQEEDQLDPVVRTEVVVSTSESRDEKPSEEVVIDNQVAALPNDTDKETVKEVKGREEDVIEKSKKSEDAKEEKESEEGDDDKKEDVEKSEDKKEEDKKEEYTEEEIKKMCSYAKKSEKYSSMIEKMFSPKKDEVKKSVETEEEVVKSIETTPVNIEEIIKSNTDAIMSRVAEYMKDTNSKLDAISSEPVQKSVSSVDRVEDVVKSTDSKEISNTSEIVDMLIKSYKEKGNKDALALAQRVEFSGSIGDDTLATTVCKSIKNDYDVVIK